MPWSVLQTFPGAAEGSYDLSDPPSALPVALRHLMWQGFKFYNPRIKQRVGATWRACQLFKDYVFVDGAIDRWRALNSTRGVVGLLMVSCENPAIVPEDKIRSLMERHDARGFVVLNESRYKKGQRVQVRQGPAAWGEGVFDGQKDSERVFVLMTWLGCSRRVEVAEDNLVAA